ncbi:50S Ribosomal protein L22p/L17e [Candidatus Hodgkinia cicadicola]|nr:50S Ribosomal protein L22p/L17e [Candidatus Hodgkinia cicadicola]
MLVYNLSLVKYSPKKLEQLADQLRGEVRNVLSFVRRCDRTKICATLSKFLLRILMTLPPSLAWVSALLLASVTLGAGYRSARLIRSARQTITPPS